MENPWTKSDGGPSRIVETDRAFVEAYNRHRHADTKIIEHSFAQPYIGDPEKARVVLLALNPGHSELDKDDHSGNTAFIRAMELNLRHELLERPFYPLDPRFRETGAGKWWWERTSDLRRAGVDNEILTEKLMVIEWFPYHTKQFSKPRQMLASQEYSFQLAKQMIGKKLIVRMRSRREWASVHPALGDAPSLNNPRCGHISRGNTTRELFSRIVAELRGA